MVNNKCLIPVLFICVALLTATLPVMAEKAAKESTPVLKGPYLGQKAPGRTAEIFAPGVVSTDRNELNAAFSPDGKELFFSVYTERRKYVIMTVKQGKDGTWTRPGLAPFSGRYSDVDPNFSPDGKQLFFCAVRPHQGSSGMDIWYVNRTSTGWSEAIYAAPHINTYGGEVHPVKTRSGMVYFASSREGGHGDKDIYRAKMIKGRFSEPENLGPKVNSPYNDGDAFVAPDESYLVVCSTRPGGFGGGDLYVCYQNKDGSWTAAKNLGKAINTDENEYAPVVSPDGKYLFFARMGPSQDGGGDVYWIDAGVLKK